jgi:hypothetical protein
MLLSALLFLGVLPPSEPFGTYVEGRTAAVYAGACHFGGQYTTQGREAVLGWSFEGGIAGGTPLAGTDLVVVLAAAENLDQPSAARRSRIYLDRDATESQRQASHAWLLREHRGLLGEVVSVTTSELDVGSAGDAFRVRAPERLELSGTALPERACCKMEYNVWYEPFVPLQGRLVGATGAFSVDEPALQVRWSRPSENDVFFGEFGPSRRAPAKTRALLENSARGA